MRGPATGACAAPAAGACAGRNRIGRGGRPNARDGAEAPAQARAEGAVEEPPQRSSEAEQAVEDAEAAMRALEDELADPAAWATQYESAKSEARHTAARRAVEDAYARAGGVGRLTGPALQFADGAARTARNVAIVALIAAAVFLLPGGGQAASTFEAVLLVGFGVGFGYLGLRLYREYRVDAPRPRRSHRAMLYGSLALAGVPRGGLLAHVDDSRTIFGVLWFALLAL